jgi:hypothetical protein
LAFDGAAQNTIAGTVSDQRGAVISQAEVTLIDSDSQQTRATIKTDNQGRFGFNNVPAGNYLVQAQAPGFRTQQVPAETQELPRQAANQLSLRLEAGATTETVQVAEAKKAEGSERNQQGQQQGQSVAVPKRPYIPPSEPRLVAGPQLPEKKVDDKKPVDEAREVANEVRAAKQGERSDAAPRARVALRDAEAKSKDQKLASKEAPAAAAEREEAKAGEAGRARRNQESDAAGARPPAAPAPSSRAVPTKTSSPSTKQIGAKTFRLEGSVWVDSQYKPEDKLPVIQLIIGSDEFKRTLAATPPLKPFFDLGQVTVVWQGKVYQVRAK